jgi:hypothetical protein
MNLQARVRERNADWNELWTEHAAELISLARELLAANDGIGARIVAESLLEEEHENPDAETFLSQQTLDTSVLVAPLVAMLPSDPTADATPVHALHALARHGVDVSAATTAIIPLFAKGAPKAVRQAAFGVVVHALCRNGRAADVLPLLKGNAPLKAVLFDELATYAARSYPVEPFLELAIKDLNAKSPETHRKAVEVLWNLARAGVDLGAALAILEARQVELAGYTSSSQVIAAALLRRGDQARITAWIGDADIKKQLCAYRGLRMARKLGVDASLVFGDPSLVERLRSLADNPANRLPGLDE